MSAHTKGPWGLGSSDYPVSELSIFSMGVKKPMVVARLVSVDAVDMPFDEAHANWKLIAAAPELLEAAQEFVRWADRAGLQDAPDSPVGKARAAIRKATGEQQ